MVRLARKVSQSSIYHIMIRGNGKRSLFFDDEDRYRFVDILRSKKEQSKFELYSYCLMHNHVHLLISERECPISKIMQGLNVSYAMYFNRKYDKVGHLFQNRFKSEVVESDEYTLCAARYIHNNPAKAGIVHHAGEYMWSSYNEYVKGAARFKGLTDTDFVLDLFSQSKYEARRKFIEFSSVADETEFLDVDIDEDTSSDKIHSRKDVEKSIGNVLHKNGTSLDEIRLQKGRIKGTFKHELIIKLRTDTCLSVREIGELLGVNKTTVHELLK